jgi:hypothetical protein
MTNESNEEADANAKLIVSRFTEDDFNREGPRATSNITISVGHRSTLSKAKTPQ